MVVPFFLLAFVARLHLLMLFPVLAQEDYQTNVNCPKSFDCKKMGQLNFPLTNSTKYSHCGLLTVTCGEPVPQIQLGYEGPFYEIKGNISQQLPQLVRLLISYQSLEANLINGGSHVFSNFNFANSPSISLAIISPSLTFFKCVRSYDTDAYFKDFHMYNTFYNGYYLYYKYPVDDQDPEYPASSDLPSVCTVIQLPVTINPSNTNPDPTVDPFQLTNAAVSIEFHVSEDCWNCYQRRGKCQSSHDQKFHCSNIKQGRTRLILILGAVAAGVGILGILLFCIIRKLSASNSMVFWSTNKKDNYQNVEAVLESYGSLGPKRYTYYEVKKMTNSFKVKLGQGGYGSVFKGKLENGNLVAVKVLKGLKGSGEEFVNEVATISRTSHVNVVTLLGFCFEAHKRALIYEFMPNGSLDKFINDANSLACRQLGWEELYQIAVGIARGLEYLHRGCNTCILHFDIKPHNILLDADFCPKISDFGLAKLCPQNDSKISLLEARGTIGYIAPEVFCRNFGSVSHKSDVYSYGMMVLEIAGGRKNINIEGDHTSEIYFPHWIYKRLELDEELGLHGIMNGEAKRTARKMIIVGLWCIQTDPSHRPSMTRVVEMLEGSQESLQIPPKPYLSSPSRPSADFPPADFSTTTTVSS